MLQAQATGEIIVPAAATAGDDGPPAPQIDREATEVDQQQVVETTTRSGRKAKPAPQSIEAMLTEISEATSKGKSVATWLCFQTTMGSITTTRY